MEKLKAFQELPISIDYSRTRSHSRNSKFDPSTVLTEPVYTNPDYTILLLYRVFTILSHLVYDKR
jgi:hypothetical protein